MRVGIGVLRFSPKEFWAMTPVELLAALGEPGAEPMPRSALEALMARFPDRESLDG